MQWALRHVSQEKKITYIKITSQGLGGGVVGKASLIPGVMP